MWYDSILWMNGGIENPLQHFGCTVKLSFVRSWGVGGLEKEKKAEKEEKTRGSVASGRYQPPTGWMAGSGDFGPGSLAVRARAQGFSGGQRPWQIMCVHKPDAVERRRSWGLKRVEGRGLSHPAATVSAPRGLRVHRFTRIFVGSIKRLLSRASNIIKKWWKVWIARTENSAGIHMKQS